MDIILKAKLQYRTSLHKKATVALIFQIGISCNKECDNLVSFCKLGHMYVALYTLTIRLFTSRLTIVSREAKKKQAVRDE